MMAAHDPGPPNRDGRLAVFGAVGGAVLGSLVGGVIGLTGTLVTLNNQADQVREARDAQAVGTARVMMATYEGGVRYLCKLGKERRFLNVPPELETQATSAERTVVASHLTPEQSRAVANADEALAYWDGLYENNIGKLVADTPVDLKKEFLAGAVHKAMAGSSALRLVARYKTEDIRECNTVTWKLETV
jgi:hypothetical protein